MSIRKDPTMTLFNCTGVILRDIGTTVKVMIGDCDDLDWVTLMIQQTTFTQARLFIAIEDTIAPSPDATHSAFWTSSAFLASTEPSGLFSALLEAHYKIVLSIPPPASWLDADGILVGTNNIVSYAKYLLGAVSYFRGIFGSKLAGIEAFPEPTFVGFGRISPNDLVSLVQNLRVQAGALSIPLIPIIGPSTDLQPSNKDRDVWIQSFTLYPKLLDVWGVNIKEPITDSSIVSQEDFTARSYITRQSTLASIQIQVISFLATKMVTNMTCNSQVTERRLVDNWAGAMKNGFSSYFVESLRGFDNGDSHALMDEFGTWTLYGQVVRLICANIPMPAVIYSPEEMNKTVGGDETLKFLLTSSNSSELTFVLSRPTADALNGTLKLRIMNALMSSAYEAYDLAILAYPMTTDLTLVTSRVEFGNGYITFTLNKLPYDCVILVKSKIRAREAPSGPVIGPPVDENGQVIVNPPNPYPPMPSALLETIIQVPVVFGVPTGSNHANGTVYYSLTQHKLMCWVNGSWIDTMMLANA